MRAPLQSTAWLSTQADGGTKFLGSCSGFRRRDWLITAAHCVRGTRHADLAVFAPDSEAPLRVDHIVVHPNADVALLRLEAGSRLSDRFAGDTSLYTWGIPVSAFGYPEDTGMAGLEPTARYFRGNIQRLFSHTSHLGYRYDAVELSFGAPGGLSGGPVSPDSDHAMVMGIVAENLTSTTHLSTISDHAVEETLNGVLERTRTIEKVHSVINYAIAVCLDPLTDWLNAHVPYPGADV